ncbi:Glycerophosphodiester phosphodiesterase GDE1 [Podospora conica]|nr:Glycerophosphodiester phosphodiesterase GDE1 [Schizothecium conicum]
MKFGKNLPRNQVPEWAASYIDYKGLKKLLKSVVVDSQESGKDIDLAEFYFALDRNLEEVDTFFNKKLADVRRRIKALQDRYGPASETAPSLDDDETEELMGTLLELRSQLRNLQWFGEVNLRGFVKITKKLDKKVPNHTTQHRYISTKVNLCPFAQDTTSQILQEINSWLAVLGGPQNGNVAKPEHSTQTLGRHGGTSAQAMSAVPPEFLNRLYGAIREDDDLGLGAVLSESHLIGKGASANAQDVLLSLLQRSITARSRKAMNLILTHVSSLDEPDDINKRNCIHRLIIHIGRKKTAAATQKDAAAGSFPFPGPMQRYTQHYITPATSPLAEEKPSKAAVLEDLGQDDEAVHLLLTLLESLGPEQRSALRAKDIFGRIPLHYAAQYGLCVVCQVLMKKMQDWGLFNVDSGIDAPEWQDEEGHAPVHLSVLGGHPMTTMALLRGEDWHGVSTDKAEMRRKIFKSSAVLTVATKANFVQIVQMLVDAGVDINWSDKTGETALHVAARFGHAECAKVLIRGAQHQKANLDVAENSFAWTPLHIAAVDGHLSVARLLVEAGADVDRLDSSGWTAKEHASLRGHLDIARLLAAHSRSDLDTTRATDDKKSAVGPASSEVSSSSGSRRTNGSSQPVEPIKTFGHRYLTDESMVLVSLGSMDMRKNVKAVTLDKIPLNAAHATKLDTALSVVVSAQGAHGEPFLIDLPVHENISTEPIVFTTTDAAKVKLLFDIVPTYSGNKNKKIGRGVALLSSIRPTVGNKRMNLQGDVCVPILSSDLDVIGTVNFNFLVITPFQHPNMEVTSRQTYWKKMTGGPMVIGHRGLGKNLASNKSLQLGENTVPSFIAAANLGAQYVEFDVQLTKDHVPVIYHDFLVSETGFDAPVHTLTLEQFLHLNPPDSSRNPPNPLLRLQQQQQRDPFSSPRQRSMSMHVQPSSTGGGGPNPLHERMKHTRDFKAKGFKANSRGTVIQAPFATLDDLFRQLPEAIGFNIELKYPMLHESEEHDMDTYSIELNSFCDAILQKVYDHLGQRRVIFSSFNPDVCLCLSFKQPSVPILFLTDAGSCEVGDVRATSLQEAVRFARRWNLLGVVSAAEPFVISPRLVRVVKESGLVCVSYGVQNNESELVERQVREGIDAVIVDSVLAIRKGLTMKEEGAGVGGSEG